MSGWRTFFAGLGALARGEMLTREQFTAAAVPSTALGGGVSVTGADNLDQAKEVGESWNSAHGGYANRHKTAVLWGGLKYDKLGLSPQELEYVESLRSLRIDYYMVFRVYPAMLAEMTGETGLSQGSSTDSQRVAGEGAGADQPGGAGGSARHAADGAQRPIRLLGAANARGA